MDKPNVQSNGNPAPAASTPAPRARPPRADGAGTRQAILQAARRRLCESGYARLNVRDIARDAGVNHALIGYHFGGKQQLVLAVLDDANQTLLQRQARMYHDTASATQKWHQACAFYEQDLDSGFVRLLMELMGASFNDKALRAEFVPRMLSWHKLVEAAVTDVVRTAGLKLPVPAHVIAAWIGWFWIGMEASMTLDIAEDQGHQREALAAVNTLLELADAGARRSKGRARGGRS